jgi:hypothetical protein
VGAVSDGSALAGLQVGIAGFGRGVERGALHRLASDATNVARPPVRSALCVVFVHQMLDLGWTTDRRPAIAGRYGIKRMDPTSAGSFGDGTCI